MKTQSEIIKLKTSFREWLRLLGFAASTVKSFPNYIEEMLHYFEANNITEAKDITAEAIKTFFFQWKNRKNKTTGAGLSPNHVNKGITAINNFVKFLYKTGKIKENFKLGREQPVPVKIPEVLTQAEIKAMYKATYNTGKRVNETAYGQRDRAMLAIYYGCGLRRNEGNNLQPGDIITDKNILLVRKGKGNKERFVPIAAKGMQDIQDYLSYGRKWFLEQRQKPEKPETESFFINMYGEPMREHTQRIRALKEEAGINKKVSLHTFRHSIATHLLQGGMDIEQIKKFLGHSGLESTQIYTHIINEL